jgi:ABC-2 type transport system ATP-binding protein
MSAAIIAATGLTKRFGAFTAVDDLTLSVEPGAIFAFLGANGSGKSTTIRMLIGLLEPTAGTIRVDGIDVIEDPRRVRERIGYMGQKVSLYQGITLRENVEFYAGLYGIDGAKLESRWGAVRERFALGDAEGERPESLPAGVRQRAGLALATLHEPRLLFLDEPTAGVDVASRDLFWQIIQDEAGAGRTVFVTTNGRLVANATPEALRAANSGGYRLDVAAALGTGALERLAAAGFVATPTREGVTLRRPQIDAASLDALAAALGPAANGGVQIEQPTMNAVFSRIIARASEAASS